MTERDFSTISRKRIDPLALTGQTTLPQVLAEATLPQRTGHEGIDAAYRSIPSGLPCSANQSSRSLMLPVARAIHVSAPP